MDLVEILPAIPDAIIDLRYATANNITGEVLYKDLKPQLVKPAVDALVSASTGLRSKGLHMVIWDAYRPLEAQQKLRAANSDDRYVLEVSKHCQGLAIDLTLADNKGVYLDMGTDHDDFTEKAHAGSQVISDEQAANRKLLSDAMEAAGFKQWPYEWWHFDYVQ